MEGSQQENVYCAPKKPFTNSKPGDAAANGSALPVEDLVVPADLQPSGDSSPVMEGSKQENVHCTPKKPFISPSVQVASPKVHTVNSFSVLDKECSTMLPKNKSF